MSLATVYSAFQQAGHDLAPASLLAAARAMPPGPTLLADHAPLFYALDQQFPFIAQSGFRACTPHENADGAALLRWTVDQFGAWTDAADPDRVLLVSLMVIMNGMRRNGVTWPMLASRLTGNAALVPAFTQILAGVRQTLSIPSATPEWERQLVRDFTAADEARAWFDLVRGLRPLLDRWLPPWTTVEAAAALAAINATALAQASSRLTGALDVIAVLAGLTGIEAATLAVAATSDRVRFLAVHRLVDTRGALPPGVGSLIVDALVQVSQDPDRWAAWMAVFAPHPIRFPSLYPVLGRALAFVGPEARLACLDRLPLEDVADGRLLVANCLVAFANAAPIADRKLLWAAAYERWRDWDFAGEMALLGPMRSALDVALVGYAIENLSTGELDALVADLDQRFDTVEQAWHNSFVSLKVERNGAASRLLPFAYARHIGKGSKDWLDMSVPELPNRARSLYSAIKFGQ